MNFISAIWSATGGRDGGPCLSIPILNPTGTTGTSPYILAAPAALDFMNNEAHSAGNFGGGLSFSVWINASMGGDILCQWPGLFGIWNADNSGEVLEVPCPSRIGPSGTGFVNGTVGFYPHHTGAVTAGGSTKQLNFGGRWNHWAFVKGINAGNGFMRIYCNGQEIDAVDANGLTGDPNADLTGPLFTMPIGNFKIATRGDNWAMWSGKMDDFKVYDYALSAAEVQYLATDGVGTRTFELPIPENIKPSGVPATEAIDLKDLAVMCDQWHDIVLWP